jgi:hypothetical protein
MKISEENVMLIMSRLTEHNIKALKITYDGSGDSGAIDNICYTTKECKTQEDIDENISDVRDATCHVSSINTELNSSLEDFFYELLETVEDWYNDDGGFGTIYLFCLSGEYKIVNNVREMLYDTFNHEGKLINFIK